MSVDVTGLRAFLAVAETGSFSRAAAQQYVTQPAISKRIAVLEHQVKAKLFDRIGRKIRLTPAGIALRQRAQAVIGELVDIERALSNLGGDVHGELRIATSHHIGLHRLPPALKRFHRQFPAVSLDLRFMDSEQGCEAVARGDVELAVVTLPTVDTRPLIHEAVWQDPLEIVVAARHPLAKQRRLTLAELLRTPAILPGPKTYTRELILAAVGAQRHKVQALMSSNYLEVLKMLVSIGLGWSALPRTLIDADVKVVHIQNVRIARVLGIVRHRQRTLSNAALAFSESVRGRK